ncbi:GTP pyrophosphokinase [Paenibacillus xylanexedens]|uniref:GTP pyrophosphokinase n=1 Tax=Paenibacillus xylanexedens TaxID=528191 RepID=UPI000F52B7E0|nr:hypothetical protein [Paenibacillus xylanexedens]RPK29530.1 hypothetical protein EDO6_00153 [Paenibacillus xylanexedens]
MGNPKDLDKEFAFDFEAHKQKLVVEYLKVQPLYEEYSFVIKQILHNCLVEKSIYFHSIEARSKSFQSFGDKAAKASLENPNNPKYQDPLKEITDLAGIRIITFFQKTVAEVDEIIRNEFNVIERSDKSELLDEKLGYQNIHYLINFKPNRSKLNEYTRFNELIAEIQVRTIMQHAWAEIEHDIQYKSEVAIPKSIKRRFTDLAGLLEIADREFQSIQDEDERLRIESRVNVREGRFSEVEITPDALREYLNKKFGQDGRMTEFSYMYMTNHLLHMGFKNFKQIDDCIKNYDADKVSKIIWGNRQGQITRFEEVLLAGLGENIKHLHPYVQGTDSEFWIRRWTHKLNGLKESGIEIGSYKPNLDS